MILKLHVNLVIDPRSCFKAGRPGADTCEHIQPGPGCSASAPAEATWRSNMFTPVALRLGDVWGTSRDVQGSISDDPAVQKCLF